MDPAGICPKRRNEEQFETSVNPAAESGCSYRESEEDTVGGLIPLSDASRRPVHFPIVTMCIILTNCFVFALELRGGDAFVLRWAAVPANIVAGHHWLTILTAMFLHGSWSHIIGNMVFLWAFGPEIEDAMNPLRYLLFYLARRAGGYASPSCRQPQFHSSHSGRERRNCGCHGRISGDVPSR